MSFKNLLVFCAICSCKVSHAVDYKIGSRVFITKTDVDKVFAKLSPLGFTREAVVQRMIYARSVVLALKMSKQIPEVVRGISLVGYEADEAMLAQYMHALEQNFSANASEIEQRKILYSHIEAKDIYLVREIVVKQSDANSLIGFKNIVAASADKAKEFGALARKYSIAKSGQKNGQIGYYNPAYGTELNNCKQGDLVISGNTLYFIEAVVEFKMPSDSELAKEVVLAKMSAYISTLLENFPVEVAEV